MTLTYEETEYCEKCGRRLIESFEKREGFYKWCLSCGKYRYKYIMEGGKLPLINERHTIDPSSIKQLREDGFTQREIAEAIGCSEVSVYKVLRRMRRDKKWKP